MTIPELRWLLELEKHMNFTKTAEALYITQPSLSQCVQRAETELGFTIFERSRRHIAVTEPGRRFLETARRILQEYDSCVREIRAEFGAQYTQVRIGVTPYISGLISRRLHEIQARFPETEIRLYESNSVDLVDKFNSGDIQLLCTSTPMTDPGCHCLIWDTSRLILILRKGSPLAALAVDTGEEYPELDPVHLKGEPLAISAEGSSSRLRMLEVLNQAGIAPEFVQSASRPTTLCTLARNGVASSMFPGSNEIRDALKDTHCLYFIPRRYPASVVKQCLVYHKKKAARFPEGFLEAMHNEFRSIAQLPKRL